MTLTNPFSEEQETSARSASSTPMPDMETITPGPERKRNKSRNPFLEDGAVINPFIASESRRKIKVQSQQSEKSSTSTLFDDSNPFKMVTDIRVRPQPPARTSSLIKPQELSVTLEENLEVVSAGHTVADCGEFQCPDTERLSPQGCSADPDSADCESECEFIADNPLGEISQVSQQLESSANISISTKHLKHLSHIQDKAPPEQHVREVFSDFTD